LKISGGQPSIPRTKTHGLAQCGKEVTIRIDRQGDPRVNNAVIRLAREDMVLLDVDMVTKQHDVPCFGLDDSGVPFIEIITTSNFTRIAFTDFPGLKPCMVDASRYTIRVLLTVPFI